MNQVKKFIMSMKNTKAIGFSGISAEDWKDLSTRKRRELEL
jgi:hypothetical protein